jgi:hypothetical protein
MRDGTSIGTGRMHGSSCSNRIQKTYCAIVNGVPKACKNELSPSDWNITDHDLDGKSAITHWRQILRGVLALMDGGRSARDDTDDSSGEQGNDAESGRARITSGDSSAKAVRERIGYEQVSSFTESTLCSLCCTLCHSCNSHRLENLSSRRLKELSTNWLRGWTKDHYDGRG